MTLNDLLIRAGVNPELVLMLRYRPNERELNRLLPWIARVRPELFDAYQETQTPQLERAMEKLAGHGYVLSFIRSDWPKAIFIGLYAIRAARPLTKQAYWSLYKRSLASTLTSWYLLSVSLAISLSVSTAQTSTNGPATLLIFSIGSPAEDWY